MTRIVLKRFGQRPVAFEGRKLVSGTAKTADGQCRLSLAVYETQASDFVLSIETGESFGDMAPPQDVARVARTANPDDALRFFRSYNPLDDMCLVADLRTICPPVMDETAPTDASISGGDMQTALEAASVHLQARRSEISDVYAALLAATFPDAAHAGGASNSVPSPEL